MFVLTRLSCGKSIFLPGAVPIVSQSQCLVSFCIASPQNGRIIESPSLAILLLLDSTLFGGLAGVFHTCG